MPLKNQISLGLKENFSNQQVPIIVKPFLWFDSLLHAVKSLAKLFLGHKKTAVQGTQNIYKCPVLLKKAAFPERFATLEQVLVKPEFRPYAYQTATGHEINKLEVKRGTYVTLTKLESFQMN
jgi:hypothetical protein